jgi:hypothetical protein
VKELHTFQDLGKQWQDFISFVLEKKKSFKTLDAAEYIERF